MVLQKFPHLGGLVGGALLESRAVGLDAGRVAALLDFDLTGTLGKEHFLEVDRDGVVSCEVA